MAACGSNDAPSSPNEPSSNKPALPPVNGTSEGSGSSALDGTWDIVSYASEELAPSFVTVKNGQLSGSVSFSDKPIGCGRTLAFSIQDDSLLGSSSLSGSCAGTSKRTLTGTRVVSEPDSDTPWNGTWSIQSGSSSGTLTIAGLTATSGNVRIRIAGGVAMGNGSSVFTFVARRR